MPTLERRCSECSKSLAGMKPQAKTCSPACRGVRSRRLKRGEKQGPAYHAELAQYVRNEAPEIAHHVVQAQLEPIVREALTEDVLRSLQRMIGLTPLMMDAIEEDLTSEDATIRQRAYSLVMKYTVGHPAVIRPEDSLAGQQLVVNFQLPRPDVGGDAGTNQPYTDGTVAADDVGELAVCDSCGQDKLPHEMVSGSTRCEDCFNGLAARVKAQYGDV